MNFEFLIQKGKGTHTHSDVEIFYVMEGPVHFILEEKQYELNKDDFLVVNVDSKHSYIAEDNFLAACMYISYPELIKMLKQDTVLFWCNTAVDNSEIADEVRTVLKKIIGEEYSNKGSDVIYMNCLYYELLHILTHDFLLNRQERSGTLEEHKFDDRKHRIVEYVRLNYDKQIGLNDLAQKLFLSNAYLSKYIKRQFGMSFIEYVNMVRLNYVISQLLYSDKSVVHIAMDTGFASSAALNKAFKEKYGMTPTVYRTQWAQKEEKDRNTVAVEEAIQKQLQSYFNRAQLEKKNRNIIEKTVTCSAEVRQPLENNWSRMINIGTAADLLNSNVQQQVLYLKEHLHFEYIRFWDLYAPEMYLFKGTADQGQFNFTVLDRVLDFLVQNGLKPYMEVRVKPKKIIKNRVDVLFYKENEQIMEQAPVIRQFLQAMTIHLLNRYTASEVETWYFEVWKTELEEYVNESVIEGKEASTGLYIERFALIAGTMRQYIPNAQIGGGGFSLRYGEDNFRDILTQWEQSSQLPDFISMYNFPYTMECIDKSKNQTLDPDFLQKQVHRVREIMEETAFPVKSLHVSEWSFSVSSRNVLNDHCMKGAYLLKNMIDNIGAAQITGYWLGTDLYADYYDSQKLLNGCGGLLSKDGIPKPAYFAFEFMNRLGRYLRKRGENYVISDNGEGNWRIVCHNLKNLSYRYGLMEEDDVTLDDRDNLFADNKKKRLHFELPALREGRYLVRTQILNQRFGSLQDNWADLQGTTDLNREDLAYLERISTPKMIVTSCETQRGQLIFDVLMEPNEIRFIHISYQY